MLSKVIIFTMLMAAVPAGASTYYASPSGSGSTCSSGSPCSVTGGISKMASGDTLILNDGTYTGTGNWIGDYASPQVWPPSGSAGHYTTIQAAHVGQAIIDGGYTDPPCSSANLTSKVSYIHFDGIHFRHGQFGLFAWYGDYTWVSNCGFEDGQPQNDNGETPIANLVGGSSYGLVEDCWVWGKGRYGFYTSSTAPSGTPTPTDHTIFRRVVVRMDNTPTGWMTAGLRFYYSNTNTMENCIIVDGNWNTASAEFHGMATGGGSSGSDSNDAFYGNIVLNNPLIDCYWSEKGTGTHTLTGNVCWGNDRGLITSQDFETPFAIHMTGNTIGGNLFTSANGSARKYDVGQNYSFAITSTDDLYYTSSGGSTWLNGGSEITLTAPEYLYLHSGASAGSGAPSGYTLQSSAATLSTLNSSGLEYLPRIETGSTLATAGVGATIIYQIGVTGSHYGDTGWNTTSSNPLWPLANEQMWAAKMATYTGTGPGGNRGFAALAASTSYPLTNYIWNYLGNSPTISGPTDIYGGGGESNSVSITGQTGGGTANMAAVNGLGASPNAKIVNIIMQ